MVDEVWVRCPSVSTIRRCAADVRNGHKCNYCVLYYNNTCEEKTRTFLRRIISGKYQCSTRSDQTVAVEGHTTATIHIPTKKKPAAAHCFELVYCK